MSTGRSTPWLVFGAAVLAAAAAMVGLTASMLKLEADQTAAQAEADAEQVARLALWRMDSWLGAQIAPEAARPWLDYRTFQPQETAYTQNLSRIEPGEVLTPSPLLAFRSTLFLLHFEITPDGEVSSPQVPLASQRDLVEGSVAAGLDLEPPRRRLEEVRSALRLDVFRPLLAPADGLIGCSILFPNFRAEPAQLRDPGSDWNARANTATVSNQAIAQNDSFARLTNVSIGALLPVWLDRVDGDSLLVFVRMVATTRGEIRYQGFVVDWDALTDTLRAVSEVPGAAGLEFARAGVDDPAAGRRMLATVPVSVDGFQPGLSVARSSSTFGSLIAAWTVMLAAIATVGVALAAALRFGARRARFASAVTHELRSPLTTFRMYSEMLADGMVSDPVQQAEYLQTLKHESERLARLVENVLAYARVEEGRNTWQQVAITASRLVERVLPTLSERANRSQFRFHAEIGDPDAAVITDPDAVEQILFCLVDNACKYGAEGGDRRLVLQTRNSPRGLEIAVHDHGPGVPREHRRAIFRAFDRGARPTGESMLPGVGLGLALARGMARDLGGELELDGEHSTGARFVLRLRRAS